MAGQILRKDYKRFWTMTGMLRSTLLGRMTSATSSRVCPYDTQYAESLVVKRHGQSSDRGSRKGKEKVKSATFELPSQLDPTPPSASPNP